MKHMDFTPALATPFQAVPVKSTYLPALKLSLVDAQSKTAVNALLAPGKRSAFFINAHCVNILNQDKRYAQAVQTADLLLPDGIGVAMAAKMTGQRLAANLNGTDLIPELMAQAAKCGKTVYLFGGKPGTAEGAARTLISKFPHLRIVGTRDGYGQAQNEEEVVADINDSGADIVLVALGVPMQELWVHRNQRSLNASLTLGVGAALDFLAGNVSRAPGWVRKARSEWIWRLAQEPKRLAKRYLAGNFSFLARAGATALRQVSYKAVAQRAMDVSISVFSLIPCLPIFLATAVAIKIESKGPVFFKQTRIGKDGKPFEVYKFRSMVANAEDLRSDLLSKSDREGICFKSKNDPRITRVGKFIRRASIDELPQIINVLLGNMAIVGPRPALPSEVAAYPQRAFGRLAVKPGITGIWQVSGRANIGFDQMIDMDLAYVSSRNLLLDMILIFMTFNAVVSGRGAH